ncbi:leucine rich repeat protein [Leptospira weilii str. Ecochallenge]|uniref:Leucine rich repeat protein n=1 Tax=Leptospira weilii str. Ecochallenge TaxID=1049986 RepID=N1U149_9LEPT|nr:leucine rich repeat protein [Leptospira weilii str. Ecochallenge]
MKFRLTMIHLQKITICLFILACFFAELQAEEVEQGTYTDLTNALQNPSKVRVLNLSFQKLSTLPKEIGELQNLQTLDLFDNKLTVLPKEILQLQNLQRLDLSHNQLTILPKEIGQLQNLQELNLTGNRLKTLPKEIGFLKKLEILRLYQNEFSSEEKESIQKLLPKCKIDFRDIY